MGYIVYKRIPGYRVPGRRIYIEEPMATREQVEAGITNLAEPTLSYTRDSSNVTFTLNFTPAPVDIANAVARYKGIQFKVIRHAACGYNHRNGYCSKISKKLVKKNDVRGGNYNSGIENYFSQTGYLSKLTPKTSNLNTQVLTIPALRANITNITAAELTRGTITRTFPLFTSKGSNTQGALDGSAIYSQAGTYEFFVGLLYGKPGTTGSNSIPYKFKMCYYEE